MAISFGRMSRARADALTMKSAIKGPLPLLFAVRRYPASSPMMGTKAAGGTHSWLDFLINDLAAEEDTPLSMGNSGHLASLGRRASTMRNRRHLFRALWLSNSWPFPSHLPSCSAYGGILRPWRY